ncbi:MAG: hypothetical protein MJ060_01445 [Clostridia bacterium]|nr:hypothetical protein [Clostridia bacterium]
MSVTDQEYAEYENWAREQRVEKYKKWKTEQEAKKGAGKIMIGIVVLIFVVLPLVGWLCSLGNKETSNSTNNSNTNTATYYTGVYAFGYIGEGESVLYRIELENSHNVGSYEKIGKFEKESICNGEKVTNSYIFDYTVTTNQSNELEFKATLRNNNSLPTITGTFLESNELQIETNFDDKISKPIFSRMNGSGDHKAVHVTDYVGTYYGENSGGMTGTSYSIKLDYNGNSNTGIFQKKYSSFIGEDEIVTYEFNYSITNREFKAIFKDSSPVESISGTIDFSSTLERVESATGTISYNVTVKPIKIKITLPKEISTVSSTMTFTQTKE